MADSFQISELLKKDDMVKYITENSTIGFGDPQTDQLLRAICVVINNIERFSETTGLEEWKLEISKTEDEGTEFMIYHEKLDLITLLVEDDDEYDQEDITNIIGVDTYYTPKYNEFLQDDQNANMLITELRLWEIDSNLHQYAIDHLQKILDLKYQLSAFGGREDIVVELSFDEDEIFAGCIDEEFESTSANPDYHLPHDQFDPENATESIENGIQSWSDFSEEDDSWEDDDLDDSWVEDDEYDADWDSEEEDEWDPGFEKESN